MTLLENHYQVQGLNLLDLCAEFGTPLYVYDSAKIVSQYNMLKNAFKQTKVKIKYACKANTNINILKVLKNAGAGLDTVSLNETRIGLMAGFKPEEILYTPNCVGFEEIKAGIELGVKINIDNISILEQFGHEFGSTVPVCIRINPHVLGGGNSHIQTGHIDSKFGISIHQIRHVLRVVKANNIVVEGLHMHTGSDILDADVFVRAVDVLLDVAGEFEDLKYLDFGSGFKVAYRPGDVTTDIKDLGKKLGNRFNEYCKEIGKELELWFEPGKFLVSEAGYFLAHVNVVKQTVSTAFAGVDSGQNHLIRPMMYDAYHHITNISNPTGVQRIYSVVGYICETDTFGYDRKLNEVREGDILAIHNAGAYGFMMSSNYNSRVRPAEVLIHNGEAHLIRKRETLDDLIRNQIEIDLSKTAELTK
ncbi:MAG: diaminopimelate decarboxylase [Bacteroidetes bacterium]|nr:diaminopimelate decarboxylase [Bacteroidota bacterium]